MKLLRHIYESDIQIDPENIPEESAPSSVWERTTAVLFDMREKIALLAVPQYDYHILPGGRLQASESPMQALKREVKEEVGCECEILSELGEVRSHAAKKNFLYITYGYIAQVEGGIDQRKLSKDEMADEMTLNWFDLEHALTIMRKDQPFTYAGKFIRERELTFLEAARIAEVSPRIS